MNPELIARWSPMWSPDVHPERPWWRYVAPGRRDVRRVDGMFVDGWCLDRGVALSDAEIYAEMARIDAGTPLPRPPVMPGQVWVSPAGNEVLVTVADTTSGDIDPRRWMVAESTLDRCALVAGPTPWGRDVPWWVRR